MRILFATILFCLLVFSSFGQKKEDYANTDAIARHIPDSLTKSTRGIAKYINSKFSNQSDKIRAIYIWIAENISYDIEDINKYDPYYTDRQELIKAVLKNRKGLCTHYAELFSDIATQVGIKSYVVAGYTKREQKIENQAHSWCIARIDSEWLFFDPTWGSGGILNKKYEKRINNFYFKTKPEMMIRTHMPFDYLWQLSNYPITNKDFYTSNITVNKNQPLFNYTDSLKKFDTETDYERLVSSTRRMEKNGIANNLISARLQYNMQIIKLNSNVSKFNTAVDVYNKGIAALNSFVEYRNRQFMPKKTDPEIKAIIDSTEFDFGYSRQKLTEIKNPDQKIALSIVQLHKSIDDAMINLNEQKAFLDKYLKTNKILRKTLFYKYNYMGIPLN